MVCLQWQMLHLSGLEYRRLLCSVSFHIVAVTCVIWSLYVLIDRTTEELAAGDLSWPFWTKLVVLAIGFTGGMVFMYVQCKTYYAYFRRWRSYNRVVMVADASLPPAIYGGEDAEQQSVQYDCEKGELQQVKNHGKQFRERIYSW